MLILLDGHVKASNIDSRGREMVLSFRGPGDVLGELTFSHAEPRSSNVTAIEPVEAQAFAASEFRVYLEQRPTAALTLIDVISRRFRDANRKRVQFGDLDTVGRVAARLIELCERYGDRTDSGIRDRAPGHPGGPRELDRILARRRRQRAADDAGAGLDQDRAPTDHRARPGRAHAARRLSPIVPNGDTKLR